MAITFINIMVTINAIVAIITTTIIKIKYIEEESLDSFGLLDSFDSFNTFKDTTKINKNKMKFCLHILL